VCVCVTLLYLAATGMHASAITAAVASCNLPKPLLPFVRHVRQLVALEDQYFHCDLAV
jgi:hypothetical protein